MNPGFFISVFVEFQTYVLDHFQKHLIAPGSVIPEAIHSFNCTFPCTLHILDKAE